MQLDSGRKFRAADCLGQCLRRLFFCIFALLASVENAQVAFLRKSILCWRKPDSFKLGTIYTVCLRTGAPILSPADFLFAADDRIEDNLNRHRHNSELPLSTSYWFIAMKILFANGSFFLSGRLP